MSVCQSIALPNPPPLPPIFSGTGSPTVPTIKFGTPGVTCCYFQVPGVNISLSLVVPGLSVLLAPYLAVVQPEINAGLSLLDTLYHIPVCVL